MMKKILIFLGLFACVTLNARDKIDSLVMPVGTDTMYTIEAGWGFGIMGSIEFNYTDLTADDGTLDLGYCNIQTGDITGVGEGFASYGDVLGVSFPYTLDVTTNTHSYTNEATVIAEFPQFKGSKLKVYLTRGSCSPGEKIYYKYRR